MATSLILCGAAGRMGRRITALAAEDPEVEVVAAVEAEGSPLLGQDIGELAGIGAIGVEIGDSYGAVADSDCVTLDFTIAEAAMGTVRIAAAVEAPILIGTSGLTISDREEVEGLAENMPTIVAANTSLGVNVLVSLVEDAVRRLGDGFDCELVELHHNKKKDSPSGTAFALAEAAAVAKGLDPAKALRLAREGLVGEREADEIGVVALRGGDNPGEHTVMLVGMGERIELVHRTISRDCFASGAIRAAKWLDGKEPGLYSMRDVVGIAD